MTQVRVNAVREGDVDDPVLAGEWHGGLCAIARGGGEGVARAACQPHTPGGSHVFTYLKSKVRLRLRRYQSGCPLPGQKIRETGYARAHRGSARNSLQVWN